MSHLVNIAQRGTTVPSSDQHKALRVKVVGLTVLRGGGLCGGLKDHVGRGVTAAARRG